MLCVYAVPEFGLLQQLIVLVGPQVVGGEGFKVNSTPCNPSRAVPGMLPCRPAMKNVKLVVRRHEFVEVFQGVLKVGVLPWFDNHHCMCSARLQQERRPGVSFGGKHHRTMPRCLSVDSAVALWPPSSVQLLTSGSNGSSSACSSEAQAPRVTAPGAFLQAVIRATTMHQAHRRLSLHTWA